MPRRKTNIDDLRSSIDATLAKLSERQGRLNVPIDLAEVCRIIGVEWEFRWMVPEGVTAVVDNELKIFIRSNFSDEQIKDNRQRFTWAHEICHALLYDLTSRPPKPAEDTPRDAALEWLCQNGAGYLLMPGSEIKRTYNLSRRVSSIADVKSLSDKFGASFQATIHRLSQERECLNADYALVLLEIRDGTDEIVASAHDVWLKTLLPQPTRGQPFLVWAKPFISQAVQTGPSEWEKSGVKICVSTLSRHLSIAEIKKA